MSDKKYSEKDLSTDLNALAHETLRELFLAAKKVSIYSSSHPLSQKAINRAFHMMGQIFQYKYYFDLYMSSGHLYALNIRCKSSMFTDQIMSYMQALDIHSLLIDSRTGVYQLAQFLERFVKKLPSTDNRNLIGNFLKERKIETIFVNSEMGDDLFRKGRTLNGEIPGDFSVRNIIGNNMGSDYEYLTFLLYDDDLSQEEFIRKYNQDYNRSLIKYLIPEKIAQTDADELVQILAGKITNVISRYDSIVDIESDQINEIKSLIGVLNYHHKRDEIIDRVGETILKNGISQEVYSSFMPETKALKLESSEKIDSFLYSTFNKAVPGYSLIDFKDMFSRLLRTGQQGKAKSVINILVNHLAGYDLDMRKKAVVLLRYSMSVYSGSRDKFLMEHLIKRISDYLLEERETFEFSDLIWEMSRCMIIDRNYPLMALLCRTLTSKRCQINGIWSYDSVAVKKSIEELNRHEIINRLINDLINPDYKADYENIRNILVMIGSHEVASDLSKIISHNLRIVRQSVLKVLAELGKSSVYVFTKMLENDLLFERDRQKRELPDEQWYIARNAIFVLGSLKDEEACWALRLRINDPDVRIRRAIVQALEKIGGDQAIDLLAIMADDDDNEIRESAIIALSFVGSEDIAQELIEVASRRTGNIINIINTLGKLGGHKAVEFLRDILKNKHQLNNYTSGRISKEDVKLAVIKALGRIGDHGSIDTIREFNDSMSASQKIFFGAKLNKAAEEILKKNPSS